MLNHKKYKLEKTKCQSTMRYYIKWKIDDIKENKITLCNLERAFAFSCGSHKSRTRDSTSSRSLELRNSMIDIVEWGNKLNNPKCFFYKNGMQHHGRWGLNSCSHPRRARNFSLEYAGELHIIALRGRNDVVHGMTLQNFTCVFTLWNPKWSVDTT